MIPITLSSVCEYNTTPSNLNNTNNNSTNNNGNNNTQLTINTTQLTNTPNLNISSNNIINNTNTVENISTPTTPTSLLSPNSPTSSSSDFQPIALFRPCLLLDKEYQYCNSTNSYKNDNPLKHLYEPTEELIISDYLNNNNNNTPKISSPNLIISNNLEQNNTTNNNNEQTSHSLNFDMDNENSINGGGLGKTMPPPSLKKRSTSFSVRNVNLLSHQVAGQAPLLKLPDGKVLKPLVPREYQFYESLRYHKEFSGFTPQFHGVLDLKNFDFQYLEESFKSHSLHSLDYNHWRNKIISLPKDYQNLYIKIEDLTYLCKCPCILDLKMGTRQYGFDAPIEKIRAMEEKCRTTTSFSLGFRVCGLKVYDQKNALYSSFDKFYGRKLKKDDISSIICKFIDNGLRLRTEILSGISKRLYQLISLFEQQQCFKFYGSSLLLIYDGQSTNLQDAKINIKMVDFAHATPNYLDRLSGGTGISNNSSIANLSSPSSSTSSPMLSSSLSSSSGSSTPPLSQPSSSTYTNRDLDEGYLFGLRKLLKIINNLIQLSNSSNGGTI